MVERVAFRTGNELIEKSLGSYEGVIPFLCECPDTSCLGRVLVTLAGFARIRDQPMHYLVLPDHIDHERDRIVLAEADHWIVLQETDNGGARP